MRFIAKSTVLLTAVAMLLGSAACSRSVKWHGAIAQADADKVYLDAASYPEDSNVPERFREECMLDTRLAEWVARANGKVVLTTSPPGGAKVLKLDIVRSSVVAGGAWTGPKYMVVYGQLEQGGKVIGDFKAQRTTTGGAYAGFKGTCSFLNRCSKAIGRDIGRWLRDPHPGATLGEMVQ